MNRSVKIIVSLLGLLLLVLIGAAVVATQIIDSDKIKQIAREQVASQTGRSLDISGDLSISYFPWLGIDLGHTSLSNPPGFGDEPMLEVEHVSASIKIMPLFSGQIELNTVTLSGFKARLHTKADGSNNFADLTGANQAKSVTDQTKPQSPVPTADTSAVLPNSLSLGGIAITGGEFQLIDETSQTHLNLTDLQMKTGSIAPGKPVDIQISATADLAEPELHAELNIAGLLELSEDMQQISLSGLTIDLSASGKELPGESLDLKFSSDLNANLAKDQLSVENMRFSIASLNISGALSIAQMSSDPAIAGSITLADFNAHTLMSDLDLPAIATSDPSALTAISATLTLAATSNQLSVKPIRLTLDQTSISGETSITDFDAPAIEFQLAIDDIDADRYLPPTSETTTDTDQTTSASAAEPLNLGESLAALAGLNLDGSLTIGNLKVSNLRSSNLVITVNANRGHLRLDPLSANLYGGKFEGKVDINGAKQPPTLAISQTLSGISLAPLIADLAGIDPISGTATVTANLSTRGNDAKQLTRGLNGKLGFDIQQGTIKDINVDRSVCLAKQGLNSLKGEQSDETCPPDQPTRFTFFLANATITAGVIKNDDLFIEQARSDTNKFMHIKGHGKVDLNQEKLNYRVTASQVKKLDQGGYKTRGTPIPVKISGSFTNPSVKPDVSDLIKTQLKSKFQQQLEQKLQKDQDSGEPESTKDQLKRQLFQGLFN